MPTSGSRWSAGNAARLAALVLKTVFIASGAMAESPCAGSAYETLRFEVEGWVDEDGLAALAGIQPPGRWGPERAAEAERAILATQVFASAHTRLIASATQPDACELVVALEKQPRVVGLDLSGAELPPFAAVRAAWRWVTRNEDRAPPPSQRDVARLMPLRVGSVYQAEALDRGTARILERYHAVGYVSANVATRVRRVRDGVEVDVHIEPGQPRLVVEVDAQVDDAAARKIVEEVLRDELGGPEVRNLARETRKRILHRLREAGYFDSAVDVTWLRIDATKGKLTARVEAGRRQSIEIIGNRSVSEDDLVQRDELYDRIFLSRNTWRQMASRMEDEYQARGFYDASVELQSESDDIVFAVEEGHRFEVGEVRFEGNRAIDSDELRGLVATGHGRPLALVRPPRVVDEILEEDVERIRVRYVRAGFEAVDAIKRVELDEGQGVASVVFTVEEGPRTYVSAVSGAEVLPAFGASTVVPAVGEPLDVVALDEERDRLVATLRTKGYFDAAVDSEVERKPAGDTVDARVTWRVTPGPLHRVGDVVIENNSDVRYVVITRDLSFSRGDLIDTKELSDVQQRIYDSGVFRHVSIAPTQLDDDESQPAEDDETGDDAVERERTIAVRVAPRPPGRAAYGFGYDTRQGLTGFGELAYANLNHRAQKARLRAQIGFDPGDSNEPTQYLGTAEFVEPRLFDGPWTYQLNGLVERNTRTVDQYNIERYSIATGASRKLADHFHLGGDLQVEYAHVFDVLPVPFLERDERDGWTTAITPFVVYDGRDSVFNPQSGFFESLRLRYAFPVLSRIDLVEVTGQHTQLIPLWWKWNFVYSLRVGWVRSLDGDPIPPIRERYFVGGGESVRGFAVNSLGPYDGNGNEVGGDLAVVAKTELRIPLIWDLGLVVFVDGGGNYLTQCDAACRAGDASDPATAIRDAKVSFENFRTAAGLGLRYVTPVGPISVDYGIKLDRRTRTLADGSMPKESFGEFSVSIGARF